MLRYSIPLGIAGIVTVATNAADPVVVGGLLNVTRLGAYNLAISISGGLGVVLFSPLNNAFFPETSSSAERSQATLSWFEACLQVLSVCPIPVSFAVAALPDNSSICSLAEDQVISLPVFRYS